ncbi:M57 family metalloprotease [Niabella beijingensis]|uniref:M57 family metalloprotease n=1 Tax=Niabella beijingensis TaxID=2872700 RepID=UPI001CBC89A3|nr:M57 family metalloprotease [Niabella beijingensis]MBZ4188242.1 hypothetical protein [Niabella beijingensis]
MKKLSLLTLLLCVLTFSCKKSDKILNEDQQNKVEKEDHSVYQFIKKLGYSDSEIKDLGSEYLVDGDILFAKNELPNFSIFQQSPKTKQYGTSYYVGYNIQPNITVRIDPSMSAYASEINGAIDMWNNVTNSRINLTLTSSTSQDILITNSNLGSGICGAGYFPVDGRPGGLIRINISQIAGNSFAQRQRTIAHELGHTIGFRHTNWQASGEPIGGQLPDNNAYFYAMHLLGTPTGGDANSLMNGGECGIGATSLSSYDILAVQFMYPMNPPIAGSIPVFRYSAGGYPDIRNTDHFFTIDITELGNGSSTYSFEGIGFFAFSSQVSGTVPVYRYRRNQYADHYYTTQSGSVSGYTFESIAFYAYPSAINGALPVYRYYSDSKADHHYTKNTNESQDLTTNYVYEGIAFYAY